MITSGGGGDAAFLSIAEGQALVTDVAASGAAGTTVTYAITGGADAGRFTINPTTGRLTFVAAPDFEMPADSDADNVYQVIVSASDGSFTDTQTLSVSVADRSVAPRLITPSGFAGGVGGTTAVFLTSGFQDIQIIDSPGTITLSGAPGGDDIIRFAGNASAYTITRVGSRVVIGDGDTQVSIPVSPTGINVVFADGPRTLAIVGSNVQIGSQVASNAAAAITSPAETDPLPNLADPAVRGRLIVSEGSPVTVDGNIDVFGTTFDVETFTIAGGNVALRGGFTGGNDTIGFDEPASAYTAARSGSAVLIAGADTNVSIPISPAGVILRFPGGDQFLRLDTASGRILLGDQELTTNPVPLVPRVPVVVIDLAGLDGANGFVINGIDAYDRSGVSVAGAGDVNGDGFDDLIIGAFTAAPNGKNEAGESYVIFGKAGGFSASLDLSTLSATIGFRIDGTDVGDQSGFSVASAGDVNGDGFDDLIIGASLADPNGDSNAGESYVVFGKASGFGASLDLSSLNGSNGFRIDGIDAVDASGRSIASAGDVNGDGFDDLIIGAAGADPNGDSAAGESYVVFGKASGFGASLDLAALNGTNGFRIDGIDADDRSGRSVASAGDFNGDGFDDLIIGAYGGDPNGDGYAGESYVVFGKASGFGASLDLATLNGTNGFRIDGIDADDRSGISIASAGDVNGDGFDDLIIGAYRADPNGDSQAGESYVVFGKASGFGASFDLASLNGTNGFRLDGIDADDQSGRAVASAGDVNGDGFDDLIIGAYRADPNGDSQAGESYVVFGKASGFGASFDLASLNGTNGFRLDGIDAGDLSGRSLASAGDVNGDGFDDLIIGAFGADPNSINSGESYVIFGGATGTENLSPVAKVGTAAADNFTGNAGNDTFTNIAIGDVVRGGAGNDRIAVTTLAFADIRGGHGIDTLALAGSGLSFDLTTTPRPKPDSIEVVDLTGTGNNSLTVSALAVLNLSEDTSSGITTLTVTGNAGDSVTIDDAGWSQGADTKLGPTTFAIYTNGNARLLIQKAISVFAPVEPAPVIDLTLLSAAQGFIIQGDAPGDFAGHSVSSAGDVNGDGFDDLIVGTFDGDDGGNAAGEAYVVFGSVSGFGNTVTTAGIARQVIDLTTLTAAQGFVIQGDTESDRAGRSVSSAGDVNGDGFDDLIIGAGEGDDGGDGAGEAYVVFGSASGFGVSIGGRQTIDLTNLTAAQGFIIQGDMAGDQAGRSVSSAGDINGDGFDDLIVGASGGDDGGNAAGEAYVVFGSANGFGSAITTAGNTRQVVDLTTLTAAQGFVIQGDMPNDLTGYSVSSAGDVNGDGFDDLIVGAHYGDDGGANAGEAYVVFGSASGFGSTVTTAGNARQVIDLTTLTAAQGFIIQGDTEADLAGFSVSSAGDVNGDGFDDLIVGANRGDDGGDAAGEAYVLFGSASGFGANVGGRQVIDLTTFASAQGFIVQGDTNFDFAGRSVSGAGDVNGDGFDDLIVGAYAGDDGGNYAGEAYVVFGSASGFGSTVTTAGNARQVIDLTSLTSAQGFIIQGDTDRDSAGYSVSSAGDVNGDGFDDLIVGANLGDDGGAFAGEAYVIFGGASGTKDLAAVARVGTAGANNFTGNAGDDSFTNIGTGDVVRGGAGDDSITVTATNFADIDGGRGTDTLALAGAGVTLDLTTTPRPRLDSVEIIDLTGTGNNSLIVSARAIYQLTEERSGGEATLIVQGNTGDSVTVLDFTANGTRVVDGITYNLFEQGNANLLVESGVTVTTIAPVVFAGGNLAIMPTSFGEMLTFAASSSGNSGNIASNGNANGADGDATIISAAQELAQDPLWNNQQPDAMAPADIVRMSYATAYTGMYAQAYVALADDALMDIHRDSGAFGGLAPSPMILASFGNPLGMSGGLPNLWSAADEADLFMSGFEALEPGMFEADALLLPRTSADPSGDMLAQAQSELIDASVSHLDLMSHHNVLASTLLDSFALGG